MLISSSWCSGGIFLCSFISSPSFHEIEIGCLKLQCFLNMVNPRPVSFVDDLDDVSVVCLPSCLVSECLYGEPRLGGRGKSLPSWGDCRRWHWDVGCKRAPGSLSCQQDRNRAGTQADDVTELLATGAASSWLDLAVSAGAQEDAVPAIEQLLQRRSLLQDSVLGSDAGALRGAQSTSRWGAHTQGLCWPRFLLSWGSICHPPSSRQGEGLPRGSVQAETRPGGEESWEALLGRWY